MPALKFLRKAYRYTYKSFFSKYDVLIEKECRDCSNLLDVGCGSYSPIQTFSSKLYTVGVDAFEPSIEESRKKGIHNEYRLMNVLNIGTAFDPGSFDAVVACDLIEHLEKSDGYSLIKQMESVAKKKVIIFTPNGFLKQGDRFNNPWQIHLSGWSVQDFENLGYHVFGINGAKALRGQYAKVKYKPAFAWNFISDITELIVKKKPNDAFQLLAVKTMP